MRPAKFQKDLAQAKQDITSGDPVKRAMAAVNMGIFGDETIVPNLKRATVDASEAVRVSALYSLVLLGEKEFVQKLMPYLSNDRHQFRKLSRTALFETTGFKLPEESASQDDFKKAGAEFETWWRANNAKAAWDKAQKKWIVA